MNKLEVAFSLFDGYNKRCPQHISWLGQDYPLEYFYALKLYDWVRKLLPMQMKACCLLRGASILAAGKLHVIPTLTEEWGILSGVVTWQNITQKLQPIY